MGGCWGMREGMSELLLLNIKRNQWCLCGGSQAGGIVGASRVGFELIFFSGRFGPSLEPPKASPLTAAGPDSLTH